MYLEGIRLAAARRTLDHPKVVQELLGHSRVTVTLDTYSHVMPSLQEESAAKIDRLFGYGG